jgi:hypothetical protein
MNTHSFAYVLTYIHTQFETTHTCVSKEDMNVVTGRLPGDCFLDTVSPVLHILLLC